MKKDWDTLEVLKHARHDWLNKIQLIKGNLSLNKVDRVKDIIEEIILEARQESDLSNLNLPQFASALLTCNWDQHSFQLDYEVTKSFNMDYLDDQQLASWTRKLFENLDIWIEKFQENHLSVMIQADEKGTCFFFDFSGILTDKESLLRFLQEPVGAEMAIEVSAISEEEVSFQVFTIPLQRV